MSKSTLNSAVRLQQKQELRGWIFRFPVASPSPRAALLSCSLLLQKMKHFHFNVTFTSGYSAGHIRRRFGQDWVCRHASLTAEGSCFLWAEPGPVSVNGKGPTGSLARVSVINPKLALTDDDTVAGQRRSTNFRAVDSIRQGCHMAAMAWMAFTWCCRDENDYGGFSWIHVSLLVLYSHPLLNGMYFYLRSV